VANTEDDKPVRGKAGVLASERIRKARAVVAAAARRDTHMDPERVQAAELFLKRERLRRLHRQINELLDEDAAG
jgi:hypothetical protein